MGTIEKEQELDKYIRGWILARYSNWSRFYHDTVQYKKNGIYTLKYGCRMMDLLDSIMGYFEANFGVEDSETFIPARFSSIDEFLKSIDWQDQYFKSQYYILEKNISEDGVPFIVSEIMTILSQFSSMKERCWKLYNDGISMPPPYQQAIQYLYTNNIELFIDVVKSIIKGVSYEIYKRSVVKDDALSEAYFHTIFHVITSVLGFYPLSEVSTNDGRIDCKIETPNRIFIFEFKYSADDRDLCADAMDQIIRKDYALSDHIKQKEIIGVAVTYGRTEKNILNYITEILYKPLVIG